jgi:hypothetical protein
MTVERQNIDEDFYAGNSKVVRVQIWEDAAQTTPKTLVAGYYEITYVLHDDDGNVYVSKSSANGATEIEVIDLPNGICEVHLDPQDTAFLAAMTYRHQMNLVDDANDEETVMTGKVKLFRSFARRYRSAKASAYIFGG